MSRRPRVPPRSRSDIVRERELSEERQRSLETEDRSRGSRESEDRTGSSDRSRSPSPSRDSDGSEYSDRSDSEGPEYTDDDVVTKEDLKILTFFWNAETLRLCETSSQKDADKRRSGIGAIFGRKSCYAPDFMRNIEQHLNKYTDADEDSVDIVAISTVEKTSDSYFHSEYLPSALPKIDYILFHTTTMKDIGDGDSSLRLSVYIKRSIIDQFVLESNKVFYFFGHDGTFEFRCRSKGRSSGFISINLGHAYYGTISLNAVTLPDSSKMMKKMEEGRYRSMLSSANNICLSNMMNELDDKIVEDWQRQLNVFIMGNFNYVLDLPSEQLRDLKDSDLTERKIQELLSHDEFIKVKSKILGEGFAEGVDDKGPTFSPTWSLRLDRGSKDCQVGDTLDRGLKSLVRKCYSADSRFIGWKSRIVYGNYEDSTYKTSCEFYQSYDVGNIRRTGETAIIGVFNLKNERR